MFTINEQPNLLLSYCGDYWIITNDLKVTVKVDNKEYIINIPKGFVTDFASFGDVGNLIYGDKSKYTIASIVHDYIYHSQCLSKDLADTIFRIIMEDEGISYIKRWSMYLAVKWFGSKNYGNKDRDKIHVTCNDKDKCNVLKYLSNFNIKDK